MTDEAAPAPEVPPPSVAFSVPLSERLAQLRVALRDGPLAPGQVAKKLGISDSRLRQVVVESRGEVYATGKTLTRLLHLRDPRPARPSAVTVHGWDERAIGFLRTAGPAGCRQRELRQALGCSKPAMTRLVGRLGERVIATGRTKSRRLCLAEFHSVAPPAPRAPAVLTSPPANAAEAAEGPGALGVETRPPAPSPAPRSHHAGAGASAKRSAPRVAPAPVDGSRRVLEHLVEDLEEELADLERRVAVTTHRRDMLRRVLDGALSLEVPHAR